MIIRHFRSNYSILSTFIWLLFLAILNSRVEWEFTPAECPCAALQLIDFLNVTAFGELASLFIIISLIAFSSYLFNNSYIIDQYRSFIPMLITVTFLGAGKYIFILSPAHFGLLFIMLALLSLLNIDSAVKPQNSVTNAALLLSGGSLLNPALLYFVPVIWMTAGIFKYLNLRTFLASLIGLIIPYLLLVGIVYLVGDLQSLSTNFANHFQAFNYSFESINQGFVVFLVCIGAIALMVLSTLRSKTERLKTYSRNVIAVIILFLLLDIVYFSFGLIPLRSFFIYSSFPLSILLSIHLNHIRPGISNAIIIYLMIASLIGFIAEF